MIDHNHQNSEALESPSTTGPVLYDFLETKSLPDTPQLDAHPVRDDIAALRCRLPFVSIIPFPRASVILALGANVQGRIDIPDNAVLMKLSALGDFWFTDKGAANGQTSAQQSAVGSAPDSADMLFMNFTDWFYVGQMKSISVMSVIANNIIGAQFIMRDQI